MQRPMTTSKSLVVPSLLLVCGKVWACASLSLLTDKHGGWFKFHAHGCRLVTIVMDVDSVWFVIDVAVLGSVWDTIFYSFQKKVEVSRLYRPLCSCPPVSQLL